MKYNLSEQVTLERKAPTSSIFVLIDVGVDKDFLLTIDELRELQFTIDQILKSDKANDLQKEQEEKLAQWGTTKTPAYTKGVCHCNECKEAREHSKKT